MQLVLLRHGESVWNRENRFTGWVDVDLSAHGIDEAHQAGRALKERGFAFDAAHTSLLQRAIRTLWIALDELDLVWLPVEKTWRLNERHYGALQGLNKAETAAQYGEAQVEAWRRSYDVRPPALGAGSPMHPRKDKRYAALSDAELPLAECLKDTEARTLPYWHERIVPQLRAGKRVLVVAHGNSLRALVKHLDKLSGEEIARINIPTGVPLVYDLDEAGGELGVKRKYYLGDPAEIERKIASVANQAKRV